MALEQDLVAFLRTRLSLDGNQVFYQHLERKPSAPFAWFIRNGDDDADSLDDADGEEPFTVYFDLEIYADSPDVVQTKASIARKIDFYGDVGSGRVQSIEITDQKDDYELQAQADTLPPYSASFRIAVSGYEPS